ncbi:hypothetical protein GCM10007989_12580 [Devosia pacifica]|uniref:Uncharacterized protein n=1 Tax=Devosia pacifica TaxID=1335967 RepID=A0A918VSH2_9HYPH|nr:hypothetical protein [Devosia pacifica]GHA18750.1 hypothetical protein GCM10007989_12580 [Devosia pacifica]
MNVTWTVLTQQQRMALRVLETDTASTLERELGEQLRNLGLAESAGPAVTISPLGRAIIPTTLAD